MTAHARDFGAIARSGRQLAKWLCVIAGVTACTRKPPSYPNWQQCMPRDDRREDADARPAPDGELDRALQLFSSAATARACGDVVGVAVVPAGPVWNAYPCPLQNDRPPEPWRIDTASAHVHGGECTTPGGTASARRGAASASAADERELLRAFEVAYRDAVARGRVRPDRAPYAASILLEGNTWYVYLYPASTFLGGETQYLLERRSLRITKRAAVH